MDKINKNELISSISMLFIIIGTGLIAYPFMEVIYNPELTQMQVLQENLRYYIVAIIFYAAAILNGYLWGDD